MSKSTIYRYLNVTGSFFSFFSYTYILLFQSMGIVVSGEF